MLQYINQEIHGYEPNIRTGNDVMKHLNCSIIFNRHKDKVLFCKGKEEPYKGLYNFVGGKVELGEQSFDAAYRELQEETGIRRENICLFNLMDFTYYEQEIVLEIYVGQLQEDVQLVEEVNPLEWLPLTENFADPDRFACDQNIAHIINVALKFPIEERIAKQKDRTDRNFYSVDIAGCRGGWITAAICNGKLDIYKFDSLNEITDGLPFEACLIDMVI